MGRNAVVAAACALAWLAPSAAAEPGTITLPTPAAARVQSDQLIRAVGGLPDRLLSSDVPGQVVNDEVVRVGLRADGGVQAVTVDQRLSLRGTGDYAVRERGPARSATSLGDGPPPVTRRGAVVWQGFSPGRRDLAARLVLDPAIEQARLPLAVSATFTAEDGTTAPVGAGGIVPGPGTLRLTIRNATSQPQQLPSAADADPEVLASLLDSALVTARKAGPGRLPSTDNALPPQLAVDDPAASTSVQAVPIRLTGTMTWVGTTGLVGGPGTQPVRDGAVVAGTLGGSTPSNATSSVTFVAESDGPGRLNLDLTAVTALNPAELLPPRRLASWVAWAAASPPVKERRAAIDLLIAVAATGARASSYSPYLGADLEGGGSTTFRFAFAPAEKPKAVAPAVAPKWGAIGLASLALLLIIVNCVLLWRRA